ncbi:MAG: MFS transporter, partial [Planctomycetota bacterium]|nr:MFS transporter [Planctomycetota bacterium]
PPAKSETQNATGRALGEIKRQPLLTLFLLAVPVSCIHQFYFVHTAGFLGGLQEQASGFIDIVNKIVGVGGGGLMTIGQMSEIGVLAMMPLLAAKLSRKHLLALGLIAYAVRMALFANHEAVGIGGVMVGVAMHGFAFGCFIFVAFMVVDENTSSDVRASAQSLFNLVIIGIGTIVGSKIATSAASWSTHEEVLSFNQLFSYPMWASIACLVALLIFYPNSKKLS